MSLPAAAPFATVFIRLSPSPGDPDDEADIASAYDRAHFLAVAACAMRQVIVDHARARRADKRGDGATHEPLDDHEIAVRTDADRILAVNEALERLGHADVRLLRVVECRFFAGYTEAETAEALSVSTKTVERDWLRAKASLSETLQRST